MTTTLLLAAVFLPLVGAALSMPPWGGRPLGTRPWFVATAALPALVLAWAAPDAELALPWMLLDVRLELDPLGRVMLVMTALLWSAAGAHAARSPGAERAFVPLYLLTMGGNFAVLLAGDVVTFYVAFALMTFVAYGMVVHSRSASALRAGRVYVVLAVLAEVLLVGGLVLVVADADSTALVDVAAALGQHPQRDLVIALLVSGFAVKVGVVPLHLWLPLAHPAAPTPASAVLSGTMIATGVVGWLRFLPLGVAELPVWSAVLVSVGLVSMFFGVAVGVLQDDPKVNLAYSSISQMGIVTMLVGVACAAPATAPPATGAAIIMMFHHGLAKAALFLGVGLARESSTVPVHRAILVALVLPAVALAGAPLTSGAVAKSAAKDAVGLVPGGWGAPIILLLAVGTMGTTVLMARFLWLVRQPAGEGRMEPGRVLPWAILLLAVGTATWVIPAAILPGLEPYQVTAGGIWDDTGPVLLGIAVALVGFAGARRGVRLPRIPPGDLVVPVEKCVVAAGRSWTTVISPRAAAVQPRLIALRESLAEVVRPSRGVDWLDRLLTRWPVAGLVLVGIAAAIIIAL